MDDFDRAAALELETRQRALQNQLAHSCETEQPYEEDGIRYCLDCGDQIPASRLQARPESVRCVDCKTIKEQQDKHHA